MNSLPTGTVTFLFTDIEGSTKLWDEHPEAMKSALEEHDSILKEAIELNHGYIIKTTGDVHPNPKAEYLQPDVRALILP